jgi:hypothetical protein
LQIAVVSGRLAHEEHFDERLHWDQMDWDLSSEQSVDYAGLFLAVSFLPSYFIAANVSSDERFFFNIEVQLEKNSIYAFYEWSIGDISNITFAASLLVFP